MIPRLFITTRSACAPGRKVPFLSSMPKHLLLTDNQHTVFYEGDNLLRGVICGTFDGLPERASREEREVPDASVKGDNTTGSSQS